MRILILIVQFPPDVNTSGLLMGQLADDLVSRGHQVSVITSFPHYEKFRIWDEYRGKLFQSTFERGMHVLRLWIFARGSKGRMLHRLMSYLSFSLAATLAALVTRDRYDVILCSNGSFFTGLAARAIGKLKHAPFIYNVQDLYPETPVQAGQLRNRAAIVLLERLERFMYRSAAHITVIAESFRDNILRKGVPDRKVSVIPNFVDPEFIRPLPKHNAFSRQHGLDDKFVITHAGNLGYVYDFDALLDCAALLKPFADIVFLIVGDGVMRPRLIDKASNLGLNNVLFLPFQPRETLPLLRAATDVQVALYRRGAARYSMPSKVYEIMASGRPVLASAESGTDLWTLVTNTRCGICVEPHQAVSLAAAIQALHADAGLRSRMGERGRAEVEAHYSRGSVADRYEDLLWRTTGRAGPESAQAEPVAALAR